MKIVITGGAGRLGPFIVRDALQQGHEVLCLDTSAPTEKNCPSLAVDLRETDALIKALEGVDAVIHLARLRFPYTSKGFDPKSGLWKYSDVAGDAERFGHNVTLTYNILAASVAAGVKKLVCGSSLAVYGLYYPCRPLAPEYLPVDEDHPLKPQDPYGMTKLVGENLCAAFAASRGIRIASMRFSGIASADQYPTLRKRRQEPLIRGTGALWSFIDVRDAAIACRLAAEKDFSGHQTFNICAGKTIMKEDTSELVERYLADVKVIKGGLLNNWCGYDSTKAESVLGFRAVHLLEN
jgi:nucleoside-diphosphate-sugar epimerase